ncbi:hypothetical protein [Flavobacterium johnsoniae]|uniref:Uncharacterized protein n=1 Tax=Flavobacterium johnsoniae TaxID=986 RepID=A0A1J7CS37_FLAJO|nr:hypothetical protein [Flavobacterium johnsoniae]OIV42458.1 hypothetical protein BKM63_06155 [Flavobacterium johnsoniae]
MSTKVPQNNTDQEVDLVLISKKIGNFFERINASIFRSIQFFIRNWLIVLILVIAGFGLGMFLDKTQKTYDNQIIVTPNFGSVDYLYAKVDLFQSKLSTDDQVFLKTIGIGTDAKISTIKIEPIIDVFKFVNNNEQNLEVLKLMTSNGDFKSIIKETTTSKNYPFYIITFTTKEIAKNDNTVKALLNFFNKSDYYAEVQKISIDNIKQKIKANDQILLQIDNILNKFSNSESLGAVKNDKLVYYNENVQLNDILKTKEGLIRENGSLKIELIRCNKIIKEVSYVTSIESTKSLKGKMKFILPILFVLIYIFSIRFLNFYKKQSILSK